MQGNGHTPIISVLMGVYNEKRKDHVMMAIDSILEQSITDFEFIICDDGSTGEFYSWLCKFCEKDERIRLLRNTENKGLSYTLNHCMEYACGKYFARMDADDISKKNRLEKQLQFLEKHPQYTLVGCNAEFIDDGGVWGEHVLNEKPEKRDFLISSGFIHPTIMVRSRVLREVGGYSTAEYVTRAEDYELFMRLYAAGYCGYNIQEFLFQYREDYDSLSKRKYSYRINELRVRYRGYCALGILKGHWMYVLKPLVVGLIPKCVMQKRRKRQFGVLQ